MRQTNHYRGSRLPQAKLSEDDVRDIREWIAELPRTECGFLPRGMRGQIAEMYCVSKRTVDNIMHGKAWRWLR